MTQPQGYITKSEEDKFCSLNKAIFGLKQADRAWHLKITRSLELLGFEQCASDLRLFKRNKTGNAYYIIVYVDDILVAQTK